MSRRTAPRSRPASRGVSLVEILMVVGLSSLVLTGLVYMIQQGSSHFDSSVWYKDALTRTQIALARLEEDLYKAANISEYVPGAVVLEVKTTPSPFRYASGSLPETIRDPDTDIEKGGLVVPGLVGEAAGDPGRELFSFTINRLGTNRGGRSEPGYTLRCRGQLRGGNLIYERAWVGPAPAGDVPDSPLPPTPLLRDVDFFYIEHENIKSELDPAEIIGSVVKFYVKIRDLKAVRARSEGRVLFVTRSVKLAVPAAAGALGGGS